MNSIDHTAQLLDAVETLRSIVETNRPLLRVEATADALPRMIAAAAIVRSCDLLRSAATLIAADQEGPGLLVRAAWETWLVGTYALLDGERGVLRLNAEQLRQEKTLARTNNLTDEAHSVLAERMSVLVEAERDRLTAMGLVIDDETPIKFDRLGIEALAAEVGPLLVASGLEENADVTAAYNMLYRGHSTYDTHGLAAIERLFDLTVEGQIGILNDPDPWIEQHRSVSLVSMYLMLLAKYTFETFGLATEALEDLFEKVETMLKAEAQAAVKAALADGVPLGHLANGY